MMTNDDMLSYLRRLGIPDIQPPSLAYLSELHRAHVEKIPWSTIDIVAGRPAPIDSKAAVSLITGGRSGYCYHLNGAFGELLRSLGFQVFHHRAGVQPLGQEPRINGFHLGVTVSLPKEEERWIVDVGLGDMPYEPLPLRTGVYQQGPYRYQVVDSDIAPGGWRLVHDPGASFVGVDYAPEAVSDLEEFQPKHAFYSTSPESPWINLFLVRQRHAAGGYELRGCILSERDKDGVRKTELTAQSRWLEVLADVFGERLTHYSVQDRDDLWRKVWSMHQDWKRSKGR